uniref:Si:ch73-181m17.1 n=1 Tax=Cyprinus carpio TaxID=7962 RepID=A0A8C1WZ84_CYPCA
MNPGEPPSSHNMINIITMKYVIIMSTGTAGTGSSTMVRVSRCQRPFYQFGAGDTENDRSDDGSSPVIYLLQPFIFFGQIYNQLHINNNGYLTFDWSWYSYTPYQFPGYGGVDIIAPFWTDIDNRRTGVISYRQYTSGSVLTDATQDINQYFPDLSFSASWVFVATWDRVAYYPYSGTETSFQVVLISDGHFSFVLFNYGTIAPTQRYVQAGYDTISSAYHFSITGSLQNNISSLTYSSNVNVPGRWVFRTDHGSRAASSVTTSPAVTPKPAVQLPSNTLARTFSGKPVPSLVILTTTPLTIRFFTFKGPALMFYLRLAFLYNLYGFLSFCCCCMNKLAILLYYFYFRLVAMVCHIIALRAKMSIGAARMCHGHGWSECLSTMKSLN